MAMQGPGDDRYDAIENCFLQRIIGMNMTREPDDSFVDARPSYAEAYDVITIQCPIGRAWFHDYPVARNKARVVLFVWSPHVTMSKLLYEWSYGRETEKVPEWQLKHTLKFLDNAFTSLIQDRTKEMVKAAVRANFGNFFDDEYFGLSMRLRLDDLLRQDMTYHELWYDLYGLFFHSYCCLEHAY